MKSDNKTLKNWNEYNYWIQWFNIIIFSEINLRWSWIEGLGKQHLSK